jgi:hypothetical protein
MLTSNPIIASLSSKRREQYVRFWLTALGAAESGRLAA